MKDPYQIIIQPLLTEKSTILREEKNKYSFKVDKRANKTEIARAVETIFPGVKVVSVNTITVHGKPTRIRGNRTGKKPDWKKAIVALRPEDSIEIYEGI
ncbi:MAG: 50S ribosomal protein L23 [bacterium]